VEVEREAVRFVADPLQQLERGRVAVEDNRLRIARQEDLLLALRERDHRHTGKVERLHRRQHGRELALASVHDYEVRRGRERVVVLLGRHVAPAREAAANHLGHRREVVLTVDAADAELAVVRLLRHRVLEDHHRANRRRALQVGDVEALDADRQALQVERLAQLLERLHAAQAALLGLDGIRLESDARVLLGELGEPALLATRGRADLHPRPASLREELLEHGGVPHSLRHHDLRRNARRRAVVLEDERLQQRAELLPFDVLQMKAVPVDQFPVTEREELNRCPVALGGDPDDVHGPDRPLVRRLPLGQVSHREQTVAIPRRLFEAFMVAASCIFARARAAPAASRPRGTR
jgi:hypothetical protein